MSKKKYTVRRILLPTALLGFFTLLSCVNSGNPAETSGHPQGTIEIRARLVNRQLSKTAAADGATATVAERLVLEVSGDDIAPVRVESGRIDFSRPTLVDTVKNVPVGRNRRIEMWAIDAEGNVTHIDSIESRTVNIEAGIVSTIFATLIPAAGSIYLQLVELPTNTTVHATFTALDGTLVAESIVPRAVRTFVSLDNIPHLTTGILRVTIVNSVGVTTLIATRELTFDARNDNTIDLRFVENSGQVEVDAVFYEPGVTVGTYSFGKADTYVEETGELIITEIMWSAGSDNYIELYNPLNDARTFEELTTDVNNTTHRFTNVTIAGNSYLVIGRHELQPNIDIYGDLPIVATNNSGNWVTVRRGDGAVIDRVIFATSTGNGSAGWPGMSMSARRSIELIRDRYDATENNYGKNWRVSTTQMPGVSPNMFGTPGH